MSYNSVNTLIGIHVKGDYSWLKLEMEILITITDDNHIRLHDNLCVACANLTTTLGVLKPPVDVKIALILLNSLEIYGLRLI